MGKASNVGRSRVLAGKARRLLADYADPLAPWLQSPRQSAGRMIIPIAVLESEEAEIPEWRILCALLHGGRLFGLGVRVAKLLQC